MSDLNTGLKYQKGCSDRVKWRVCQYSRYHLKKKKIS